LSSSGAFIQTDAELRLLARVLVIIDTPSTARSQSPTILAYVARKFGDGIGIAWCEFAPIEVSQILQSVSSRRRHGAHGLETRADGGIDYRYTPTAGRYASPVRLLFHCPLRAADATRSRANIALWNTYLLSDCVRSMVRMGWDYTT
jgi:hypothetical protein